MKKSILKTSSLFSLALLVLFSLLLLANNWSGTQVKASTSKTRKIVVFKPQAKGQVHQKVFLKNGGERIKTFPLINGEVALLSQSETKRLSEDANVLRVENDLPIEISKNSRRSTKQWILSHFQLAKANREKQPPQVLPWGVDRIDAEKVWFSNTADPIKVVVIDTGVDLTHPDLKENIKGGTSTVSYTVSYQDDNGHGTHVAGIIAALNNSIGVVGVGPKIDLYTVKALDRRGSGYLSDLIEAIDWSIDHKMQVVNFSLGTPYDSPLLKEAMARLKAAGIVSVAAAGNSGGSVEYPAAYPEVIAVSATDTNDLIASWSNRGPEIDLAAPGVAIYSTYKGSTYKTLSGTSMAAPHVTGAAALLLNTPITTEWDHNGNGRWDPEEIQDRLQKTAIDLGQPGFDPLYGWGLVNIDQAIQR